MFDIEEERRYYQSVIVLNAGGTISMRGSESRAPGDVLRYNLPKHIPCIYRELFRPLPDSSNIGAREWMCILTDVQEVISKKNEIRRAFREINVSPEIGGVVICHGTDTLEYTSLIVALETSLLELPFPIIFTGAHSPLDQTDSDASLNLRLSLNLAAPSHFSEYGEKIKKLPRLVYIMIGNDLHLASRIKKISTKPNKEGLYFESYPDAIGRVKPERLHIFHDFLEASQRSSLNDSLCLHSVSASSVPHFVRDEDNRGQVTSSSSHDFGYIEHIVVDKYTPVRVFVDAAQRIIEATSNRRALIIQGDMSETDGSNLEQIADVLQHLIATQVIIAMGSLRFWKKLHDANIVLLPKYLSFSRARTKLNWLFHRQFPRERIVELLNHDFAGELCATKDFPYWVQYETFGKNNYIEGREVILVYPDIHWKVFADAIDRLLSGKAKNKKLSIFGFGDGHIPLGKEPLREVIGEYLHDNYPLLYTDPFEGCNYQKICHRIVQSIDKLRADQKIEFIGKFQIYNVVHLATYLVRDVIVNDYNESLRQYQDVAIQREIDRISTSSPLASHLLQNLTQFLKSKKIDVEFAKFCLTRAEEAVGNEAQRAARIYRKFCDFLGYDLLPSPANVQSLRELIRKISSQIQANPMPVLEKTAIHFPGIFADRILQDALIAWNPILKQIARAITNGILVEIKSTVAKAKTNCNLYEIGNILMIIGVQSDMAVGWKINPLISCHGLSERSPGIEITDENFPGDRTLTI